ncbi:hypothetical protein [Perlabentimonas gracilis]|uniref:hypothetical protein n=1 Tax=Perlabentimonas gracilis TaxID=2715279 RepID=UPI00140D9C23|nr:hypothetical protein [Perlabentimonas gracilis]NHB70392.1 hypothetical protein [Perlabentimonas gracilis]
MKYLFVFLLASFISTYLIKPSKNNLIAYSFIVPITTFILCALFIFISMHSYFAGQEIAKLILPSFISGLIVYYNLKKKVKNENRVQFPILLITAIIISLIISIYQYNTEAKLKNLWNEISINNESTKKEVTTKSVEFRNIKFNCYSDWKVDFESYEENNYYLIHCEKNLYTQIKYFGVVLFENQVISNEEAIKAMLDGISEDFPIDNSYYHKIEDSFFNARKCKFLEFKYLNNSKTQYARIYSFNHNFKTIVILYETGDKNDFNKIFNLFEDSFTVN